ncbi:MAG: hypothetical protein HC906_16145 [Bacteroidales bacterium]|nr:hypothetical protein [Bacteroidales bacterium]
MKKIFIQRKHSVAKTYYFVFSDLDGSNEQNVVLDASSYQDKEFLYYSLSTNNLVDDQPDKNNWHLWFTKYYDPEVGNQLVTGVLLNPSVKAMRLDGVLPSETDTTMGVFSSNPGVIGYDWKQLDHNTFTYVVPDDITFFVKTADKELYKIHFTRFEGSSTGKVVFVKEKVD